jgi:hypothetical protein
MRFGRDLGLIRPSTRHHIEVPWIDPSWVVPPPPEAMQPRETVRYRSQTKGTRSKRVGLVRLKAGTLSLLEQVAQIFHRSSLFCQSLPLVHLLWRDGVRLYLGVFHDVQHC